MSIITLLLPIIVPSPFCIFNTPFDCMSPVKSDSGLVLVPLPDKGVLTVISPALLTVLNFA